MASKKKKRSSKKSLHKWLLGIFIAVVVVLAALYIASQVSPWPNALLIRKEFNKGGAEISQALQKHVPPNITEVENQQYRQGDKDAYLDVFYPDKTARPLPTIVWVHGGAWISGNKDNVDNYMQILAARGFTVVSVNYSIAPEKKYPVPIVQLNEALGYLQQNATRLNIDDTRVVMGGDSAGSQIVAQMANIVTSPAYAQEIGIQPTLEATKLKAVLLNCGAYDLALPDYSGEAGKFLHTVLWAYSGTKDFLHDPKLKTASVINYLTADFPPAFITAGNVDPLLTQSTELAKKLENLNVPTSALFYAVNHTPKLNHEYQFNLDIADGQKALDRMVEFAKQYSAKE